MKFANGQSQFEIAKRKVVFRDLSYVLGGLIVLELLSGCAGLREHQSGHRTGESVVLVGEEPACLSELPLANRPFRLRSSYLQTTNTIEYVAGQDFVLDCAIGTLHRTLNSRIPDFRTNILFGVTTFDHAKFPGFGNQQFFVFADYDFCPTKVWPRQPPQIGYLTAVREKLLHGENIKIVAFGDSITAGKDVMPIELVFWRRWVAELQRKHPEAKISAVNGATGGDTTRQGLQRLQTKVIAEKPDLVLVGFGMNDHNVTGVPVPEFKRNLKEMIRCIRAQTSAKIILFSTFPPNPNWKFGSHHMADYAAATAEAAHETGCAYADVFNNWQSIAARKKPEDLLANNINHPNEFGHWIYFSVFNQLGL